MRAEGPALREIPFEGSRTRAASGRRVVPGELPPAFEDAGHL